MKIANKKIVFIAQYAAMYEGNFLKSLYALEDKLNNKVGCPVRCSEKQMLKSPIKLQN